MKEKIHAQIQHLHDLLEESSVDENLVSDLKKTSENFNQAVAEEQRDIYERFGSEMEQNAIEFESRHPAISQVIKEIMRTFHNAGI